MTQSQKSSILKDSVNLQFYREVSETKKWLRAVSVVLTVVVVVLVFVTPVDAGRRGGGERRRTADVEILYLDAEIKLINGRPILVAETKNGQIKHIPFQLPQVIWLDGKLQPLVAQGGGIVVPTEDGLVNVPLEEFDVVAAGGQVVLVAEENPIILVGSILFGGIVGLGAGGSAVTALKMMGFVVGPKATKTIIATSSALGALVGGAAAPRPAPALP